MAFLTRHCVCQFQFHDISPTTIAISITKTTNNTNTYLWQKWFPLSLKTNKSFTNPWAWSGHEELRSGYIYNRLRTLGEPKTLAGSMVAPELCRPHPAAAEWLRAAPLPTACEATVMRDNFCSNCQRIATTTTRDTATNTENVLCHLTLNDSTHKDSSKEATSPREILKLASDSDIFVDAKSQLEKFGPSAETIVSSSHLVIVRSEASNQMSHTNICKPEPWNRIQVPSTKKNKSAPTFAKTDRHNDSVLIATSKLNSNEPLPIVAKTIMPHVEQTEIELELCTEATTPSNRKEKSSNMNTSILSSDITLKRANSIGYICSENSSFLRSVRCIDTKSCQTTFGKQNNAITGKHKVKAENVLLNEQLKKSVRDLNDVIVQNRDYMLQIKSQELEILKLHKQIKGLKDANMKMAMQLHCNGHSTCEQWFYRCYET